MLLLTYGALPMFVLVPLSIWLLRHFDTRRWWSWDLPALPPPISGARSSAMIWAREDFVGIVLLQAIGQSLTLLPLIITLLSNSDPSRATSFAAYIQIMRLGGAEIGVALMGTWLRVREQVHSFYLGQNLVVGDVDVVGRLKQLADHSRPMAPVRPRRARSARSRAWCSARPMCSPISTASGCASGSRWSRSASSR